MPIYSFNRIKTGRVETWRPDFRITFYRNGSDRVFSIGRSSICLDSYLFFKIFYCSHLLSMWFCAYREPWHFCWRVNLSYSVACKGNISKWYTWLVDRFSGYTAYRLYRRSISMSLALNQKIGSHFYFHNK